MNKYPKKSYLELVLNTLFFLFILVFYIWTSSNGKLQRLYEERQGGASTYPMMLSEAFLNGHTYIDIKPKPELLALENPYDPNLNDHYRMHDASLYNNRYYLYFSPVIPLLIIAPVRFLTGYFISENLLVPIFAFIGFIFSCLVLNKVFKLSKCKPEKKYLFASYFALAMLTNIPFLLRRPAVYELVIISAYAFLMVGIYLFFHSFDKNSNQFKALFISGIFFGLCIASRPNQSLIILIFISGYFFISRKIFNKKYIEIISAWWTMIIPIIITLIFLAIYNYIRFDSIFEFGKKNQLTGIDVKNVPAFSFGRFLANLYSYFLHPFKLDPIFPFIHITEPLKPEFLKLIWFTERTVGIMSYPFFWLLPLFCIAHKEIKILNPFLHKMLALIFISAALSILAISQLHGVTMRYMVDFMPLILIGSLSGYYISSKSIFIDSRMGRISSSYLFHMSIILSCLISFFASFTGTYDVLQNINPDLFNKLRSFFVG